MVAPTALFLATLRRWVAEDAQINTVAALPDTAQDHSGAIVRFYRIGYASQGRSAEIDLVTKDTLVYERQILALLNAQAHPAIPFSYALDMHTPAALLLCQEHAGARQPLSPQHLATVAQALARIHTTNRGAPYLPWMRRLTSQSFFHWWRQAWEQACGNADFAREFRAYIPQVERAALRFAQTLDRMWREGESATVLHIDLNAWHVLIRNDQPYLIDWDQARYGPFYLDLVNLFTPQAVSLYYNALAQAG